MRVLIVEDCTERFQVLASQFPDACITFARTASQALQELIHNDFDVIMLDHDLDEDNMGCNGEGIDVAKFSAKEWHNYKEKPRIIIHSANPPGAANMEAILKSAGFEVEMISFLRMEYNARS